MGIVRTLVVIGLFALCCSGAWAQGEDPLTAVATSSSTWNLHLVDAAGDAGNWSDIVVDASGTPHVAYVKGSLIMHASWNGASWETEAVTSLNWTVSGLKFMQAADGTLVIVASRYISSTYRLYVYVKEPTQWAEYYTGTSFIGQVDVAQYGNTIKIAMAHGVLRIATFDLVLLDWVRDVYGEPVVTDIDATGSITNECSLAIDPSGHVHVAYFEDFDDDLKYATFDGSTWHLYYVDTAGDVGRYNSIVYKDGALHIFYYDNTNKDLKHAVLN